jgi:hypothetical protein
VTLVLGLITPQDAGAGASTDVAHNTTDDDSYMMSIDNQVRPTCVSSSWHCATEDASMPYRPPVYLVVYAGVGECFSTKHSTYGCECNVIYMSWQTPTCM